MEHRRPGPDASHCVDVAGVIGMDAHTYGPKPGTGLSVTSGGFRPVEVPHLDDATATLIYRSLLMGGEPGSGKSVPLALLTLPEVLSGDDGATGGGHTGAVG